MHSRRVFYILQLPHKFQTPGTFTVNIKHPPTWRTIYKRLQAGGTKNTMWLLPCANKIYPVPFPWWGWSFLPDWRVLRLPKRQACHQALCCSCWRAGHWRSHVFIALSLTSHISFHAQADRTEWLPPRWGYGHPQHWSSRDVFYFKKTQQEIHRLWTPGYFQAVWGRDCQIQWTTGTVVSQGHRCYCSLQGYP